jgi:competence protein ComEA
MFQTPNTLRLIVGVALLALASLGAAGAADAPAGVVNLNTATVEQMQLLPGIGPAVAARIVAQREAEGPFRKAEELMLVRGVGERTFANMKPWIALDGKTTLTEKVRLPRAPKATKD